MALRRTAATAALVVAGLLRALTPATAEGPGAADLPRLQAELAAVTAEAQRLADELDRAAARDGGLRIAMQDLEERKDQARAALGSRAREVYIGSRPDPLGSLRRSLAAPGLERIATQGGAQAVRVEQGLVDAVAEESEQVRALRARAAAFRASLRARSRAVLSAQDRARVLLARTQELVARDEAKARDERARAQAEQARAQVVAAEATLDAVSATVTTALTPAQTRRSRLSAEHEAPILALVEAAGSGYPQGYVPSGQVLQGLASWYGPGFVGSPTASGTPYDPERLTCAHKQLPLRTVVRVTRGNLTVSCLVNDRGPYVGPRILDMSRAGSRALGYDGVAQVVIEVLTKV